ncbi:SNF2-related protein [Calothrix rhizosoleniae]|uniref:SNF2-related protein n=1 Tax=Calothrix rhizosoleniae TaxID=888997 RepID=UPI000B4A278F|nr:SNF2-related protein [Calothrix rhizosoleniae]
MAILHGSWLSNDRGGCLFIWAETWRTLEPDTINCELTNIPQYPLVMTPESLKAWLESQHPILANCIFPQQKVAKPQTKKSKDRQNNSTPTHLQIIALPTSINKQKQGENLSILPLYSSAVNGNKASQTYLQPWQVEGFVLQPLSAFRFLSSLPLHVAHTENNFLGGDLRFWSHIARWSLDLIARSKFLPTIERHLDGSNIARWQALLDSAVDGTRLEMFAQQMPLGCRTYEAEVEAIDNSSMISSPFSVNLLCEPQELILDFLHQTIDSQIRSMMGSQTVLEPRVMSALPSAIRQWLQGLTATNQTLKAETGGLERLETVLKSWTMPVQSQLTEKNQFRTCFKLNSPDSGKNDWNLAYYLQAVDDSQFLIDAATIWSHPVENFLYQNRTIKQPQEIFLRGLGLASRLYPAIAPSLSESQPISLSLNPMEAYEFIKAVAWRFEDSGLGVVLPPSLANREGWANRLGLKIAAKTSPKKSAKLGLESLLAFQWKLAIGGQTLSKREFDKLVALNSPLVEINGEWVELRPQDIKTAQGFFASRKEQMSLSLEDALRLGSGDTQTIEKLPVVSFEASGALQELLSTLTNNDALETLPKPADFQGDLRPYQQRGMAWLAFLERWGLGACLADDMGLGKCVAKDTQIYINGGFTTAADIWYNYAGEAKFDGEGFWAEPQELLMVNSINETTGKIVQAPIKRLYRQKVKEKLRKITLQNGSNITITQRHKLLTNRGWTNELQLGDYVCVPSKLVWQGKSEDLVSINRVASGESLREYQQLKPSKWTVSTLEAYAKLDLQALDNTKQSLQRLIDREVFYCQIESIEDVEYEGWVYDFEVSKHHNFIANNIICHNTIQFIAFLLHLQEKKSLEKPTLLVCPTSVLGNWEREVKKFAPTLKAWQYHGDKRPKGKKFAATANQKDLVITSYSLVHRDLKSLQGVNWQVIALDEAQNVKNPEAKQSQAVRELESTFRVALTGTPVENRLQELWSILDFLNPGYLGNRQFFQRRFAMPIEKYGDTASLNQLRSLVQPFILRRLKTDRKIIQDLPEKQEMNVFCGLSPEQAQLYQEVVDGSLAEIDEAEGLQRRGLILGLLVKLKQICNHPGQYLKQAKLTEPQLSGKLLRLQEMLEEVLSEGDRALIFTQFAEWGKLLQPYLEKLLGREVLFLYGSTKKKQREEMVDRFQHDPQGPPIMILSIKAGGVGLNLTRANHVFHFDRWWNPAVENQATDRVFRIGQKRNVQVHKFVCTGTLEEKIHDIIESKKQLAEQVVGTGENWLTELDTDQLRNLLILDRNTIIGEEDE